MRLIWNRAAFWIRLGIVCVFLVLCSRSFADDRSFDGTGNNLSNLTWGAAGADFLRKSTAAYADGISSLAGTTRLGPREISNAVIAQPALTPNSQGLSGFVFQWGQLIDHDMDLTDLASPSEPFDISIPPGDVIFNPAVPMPFIRSKYDLATGTVLGNPRQQINSNTSYLDASMVYGSDSTRAAALRSFSGGRLLTSPGNLLPLNTMGLLNADNADPNPDQYYVAGDVRVNEQVGLTAIQTLFMREHNRQADLLASQNPSWNDEQIYQQARKIVGAEVQSITFREFLPALLGSSAPGISSVYNPSVNSTIANEFATALFRVGHTMLPPQLLRVQNDGVPAPGGPLALRDAFFQQQNMSSPLQLEYILKGLAVNQQQEIDAHIVDDVRNFLFGDPLPGVGFDLAALNIQRGRDHGLPDYNSLRSAYGLSVVSSFSDITSDSFVQAALLAVYGNVNNIDPWVGAVSEDHLPGMEVGPLIAAALIDQFTRLRDGDRFWFTNDPSFTPDELNWLENVRLCDIVHWNSGITTMQANAFFVPEASGIVAATLGLASMLALRLKLRLETKSF
ncbi:MAG: peroxidase [Pirellulales bacterium]|nr:peroxidase [Pirellulales bacterium]